VSLLGDCAQLFLPEKLRSHALSGMRSRQKYPAFLVTASGGVAWLEALDTAEQD